MPHMTNPQAKVLSSFSFGVATIRRCTLSVVAEALPALGKPDTVERRLQRFLANPKIDWAQCCKALASWVIGSLRGDGLIVLLVDETSLNERLKVMAVSFAYRGRAIPLAWWCYTQEQWPMRQVELITTCSDGSPRVSRTGGRSWFRRTGGSATLQHYAERSRAWGGIT